MIHSVYKTNGDLEIEIKVIKDKFNITVFNLNKENSKKLIDFINSLDA